MKYWEEINTKLRPWIDNDLNKTFIDLFTGCSGLSLGFEVPYFAYHLASNIKQYMKMKEQNQYIIYSNMLHL